MASKLSAFNKKLESCTRCPRLEKYVASFRDQEGYWARPVPGFGDPAASLLVLGLAPGAHGANRTGRPFTGDGAGAFLYRSEALPGLGRNAEAFLYPRAQSIPLGSVKHGMKR